VVLKKLIALALMALFAGSVTTYSEEPKSQVQLKTAAGKVLPKPHLTASCQDGFSLLVTVPNIGQSLSIPIYVGIDAAAYRIMPLSENTIYAENLPVIMVLTGDTTNQVTFDAFIGNLPANALDVEAKTIDLKIDHPPGALAGSTATFCIQRLH
jgi:hypothetical protein